MGNIKRYIVLDGKCIKPCEGSSNQQNLSMWDFELNEKWNFYYCFLKKIEKRKSYWMFRKKLQRTW